MKFNNFKTFFLIKIILFTIYKYIFMGIGDWGLGIGDWGLGIGPNPQSPIPNPHFIKNNKFNKILNIN